MRSDVKRAIPAALLAATLLLALPMSAYAQLPDTQTPSETANPDAQPTEPTPVEEIAPGAEGGTNAIPGTEPLYDKGVTVTEIEITGNKLVPADTVLKAMDTKPGSLYSKRRLQGDLKKIYDLGYFTEHLRVVPVATREGVHLKIEVEENPVVNAINIKGAKEIPATELMKNFEGQAGMPQNVNNINKGIQSIEEQYKSKGYVLARVGDIQEDPPGTLNITVDEGKVGKITYTGNKKTKSYVIRRAMAQKEGEVYNEKTVADDMKRIFSLQAFSDVRRVVRASTDKPGEYELTIEVDEKKTGAISLGGGLDTGLGVFGSVGYTEPNFLGRGEEFSSIFSVGSGVLGASRDVVRKRIVQFQTSWNNPSVAETTNSLGASIFARDLGSFNVPLALERRLGGSVNWGRPIESVPGMVIGSELGFENVHLREGVNFQDLQTRAHGITPGVRKDELQDGTYAYLGPTVSYDSRDNRLNPSSGWYNSLSSRFALGIENSSYATLQANVRRYVKVTDNVTFAANVQGGANPLGDVPDFNQFRLGGPYTVRGYQEGGLGIGRQYLMGSAEVRTRLPFLKAIKKIPLYDYVSAAVFMDAGYLFDESSSNSFFGRPGYGASVGAGVRVTIPGVGPLRIDYGLPITGGGSDLHQRFNFGVGQKF